MPNIIKLKIAIAKVNRIDFLRQNVPINKDISVLKDKNNSGIAGKIFNKLLNTKFHPFNYSNGLFI
jgi:hypothetical protein